MVDERTPEYINNGFPSRSGLLYTYYLIDNVKKAFAHGMGIFAAYCTDGGFGHFQ